MSQLERWEVFGQQSARTQLCERAESLAGETHEPARLAQAVQKLRDEWKGLDKQYADVPKALWTRFDAACSKAYAPAAHYFAERAAQHKQARNQRDAYITQAAEQVPALLAEPRDWRAIERWLRETDTKWRTGDLGSVAPAAWEALDKKLRAALAPLREALGAQRGAGKTGRTELIAEVEALVTTSESGPVAARDAPSKVKAIQARWQQHAKANPLPQREDRALWERFRAACDAVFAARTAERSKETERKHDSLRTLETVCAKLEALTGSTESEASLRDALRAITAEWTTLERAQQPGARPAGRGSRPARDADPALARISKRFRDAKQALEASFAARASERQAAIWQALTAKERLCESLEARIVGAPAPADPPAAIEAAWAALPGLGKAWEQKMLARRDAAVRALAEREGAAGAAGPYAKRIEQGSANRRDALLDLELALGLEPPPALAAARRAKQLQQLKDRFAGNAAPAAPSGSPADRLVAWCAEPGVIEASDRERVERVFAAIGRTGAH